jgi:hypothetical protein
MSAARRRLALAVSVTMLSAALLLLPVWRPASTSAGQQQTAKRAASCGVERWAVKTLSDPEADQVNFTPRDSSVGRLRGKPDPHTGAHTPRLDGVEMTTYRIRVRLIEFKREDDHDIHLVVSLPSARSKTMIVEFPDPSCPGARDSAKKTAMAGARSALTTACGQPPGPSSDFADLSGTATVTGVGFFDVKHATPQTGVAPNNIELHPVLKLSDTSCQPAS